MARRSQKIIAVESMKDPSTRQVLVKLLEKRSVRRYGQWHQSHFYQASQKMPEEFSVG